jgi:arsenical pump membrane protein
VKHAEVTDRPRRWELLDLLALVLLVAGTGAVLDGLLPHAAAGEIIGRVVPLLIFLGSVFVLAELTAKAEVFDLVASRLARRAGGNYLALFGLCVVFCLGHNDISESRYYGGAADSCHARHCCQGGYSRYAAGDVDGVAGQHRESAAAGVESHQSAGYARVNLTSPGFAIGWQRRRLPQPLRRRPVCGCSTAAAPPRRCAVFGARGSRATGSSPFRYRRCGLRRVCRAGAGGCSPRGLVAGLRWRARRGVPHPGSQCLRVADDPAPVAGIRHGIVSGRSDDRPVWARPGAGHGSGADAGVEGVARAAALGAVLSNAINNLPAYVAGEAVVTNSHQLLGLLIATNVSPLVTPWASLAIIIW